MSDKENREICKKCWDIPSYLVAAALIFFLLLAATLSMNWFTRYEYQRDLDKWQLVLGIMADEKTQSIRSWVDNQFSVLEELAQNGSLQLYTQLMVEGAEENISSEPAQLDYLRNLIWASADRNGFMSRREGTGIGANIAFHAGNHLILFADENTIITGTPGISKPSPALKKEIKDVLREGKAALFNIYLNPEGRPLVGFMVPVFALQKQTGKQRPVAVLFGARAAEETLFPLLRSRQALTKTDEALLVQRHNSLAQYVSPLADGTPALKKELPLDSALASTKALKVADSSGLMLSYRGEMVLFTSRSLPGLPWVLVQKINASEALAGTTSHQRFLWLTFILIFFLVICMLAASWWHGSALRVRQAAMSLADNSRRLGAQAKLLKAISDNVRDTVLLLDGDTRTIFANRSLGNLLSMPPEDIKDKGLTSLFGPPAASLLAGLCKDAVDSDKTISRDISMVIVSEEQSFYATAVPMDCPNEGNRAVLLSLHDITSLKEEGKKKNHLMKAIVSSLMRSIDLYDSYSANHSANTAVVATAVGRAMKLDAKNLSTLETAANLCNTGKLSISRDILTKTGELTPDEDSIIRQESLYVEEILAGVPFDGPVVETITQKNEWLDGSGYPRGLEKEQIIMPARILAAANAFVAMISPRAYRDALSIKDALDQLLERVDSQLDRQVVASLFHVAENCLDESCWQEHQEIRYRAGGDG